MITCLPYIFPGIVCTLKIVGTIGIVGTLNELGNVGAFKKVVTIGIVGAFKKVVTIGIVGDFNELGTLGLVGTIGTVSKTFLFQQIIVPIIEIFFFFLFIFLSKNILPDSLPFIPLTSDEKIRQRQRLILVMASRPRSLAPKNANSSEFPSRQRMHNL